MGRPTHQDPDLDKGAKKPPAAGRRDAHQRQNPKHQAPQRPEKDDLRIVEDGDRPSPTKDR